MANKYTFKRVEMKYLLSDGQYRALRERIKDMAEVDAYGKTTIQNIYYDTESFLLIRRSLEKPVYKEKLRLRSYGTPENDSPAFIELKKKYDGVVYKRRIEMPYAQAFSGLRSRGKDWDSQIGREIRFFLEQHTGITPRMAISYDRIALAGIEDPELRITFDDNIRSRTDHLDLRYGPEGRQLLEPGQHLMEIKIAGAMPTDLARILSELKIYKTSFSKYGTAFCRLCEERGAANVLPNRSRVMIPQTGQQVAFA